MTTQRTTRRAMLVAAGAVPIAAVLADAAPASTLPTEQPIDRPAVVSDPVFAAIKEHRRLHARWEAAFDEVQELEGRLPKEITQGFQRVALYPELDSKVTSEKLAADHTVIHIKTWMPAGNVRYAQTHLAITEAARDIPKEHRAAWLADRHAALSAANRSHRAAQKASGLTRLRNRERAACDAVCAAGRALIAMQPPTIAGTLALVSYAIECRDDLMVDSNSSYYDLLNSVAWALGSQVPGEVARSIEGRAE